MPRVIETGKNPTMRYLHRTHRVSVAWLHEVFKGEHLRLIYEISARMAADIFTKAFSDKAKWLAVCDLINHVDPARLKGILAENCITKEQIERRKEGPSTQSGYSGAENFENLESDNKRCRRVYPRRRGVRRRVYTRSRQHG